MDTISIHHAQLGAIFNGIAVDLYGEKISKFMGIKYANIPARFESAQPVTAEQLDGKTIDATKYGCVPMAKMKSRDSTGSS
jgi:carboxylesterase type B